MPAKLQIQSSAKVTTPYVRCIIFGPPDQGKSMCGVTAPNPVWMLTEPTCAGSLSRDNIVGAYGMPQPEDIGAWLTETRKLKGKELAEAIQNFSDADLKEMTGITYDMPRLDITDFEHLAQALEILKSGAYETAIIDSGTLLSRLLLEHFKAKGGKGGSALRDPRQAYKKAADQTLDFIRDLFKLPMHFVITAHAAERTINKGTEDEPLWTRYLVPAFEGNVLGREIPHMIREIWQAKRLGKNDDGSPRFGLRTRKENPDDYERTLCVRLDDIEPPDLTAIFNKILGK